MVLLSHLTASMETIKYRHIKEGHGGVFPTSSSISDLIGTYNCITCVGVYFLISSTQCFVAHINAYIRPQNYGRQQLWEDPLPRDCQGDEGSRVKIRVLEKLRKAAAKHHFDPLEIDTANLILICPKYNGKPMTGRFVVEAIEEFLGRRQLPVDRTCHGFVQTPTRDQFWFLKGTFGEDRVQDGRWTEKERTPGGTVKPMKDFQACEVSGCGLWEIEIWREQKTHTNEEGNAVWEES